MWPLFPKDGDRQLAQLLEAQLEGYKIAVESDPSRADYWIIINQSQIQQQIISIGAVLIKTISDNLTCKLCLTIAKRAKPSGSKTHSPKPSIYG